MTGFEPAAPSSRTKCATKLRYIPLRQLYGMARSARAREPVGSGWLGWSLA
jgi:hypothetical protein